MDQKYSITVSETPTTLVDTTVHLYIDKNNIAHEYKANRSKSYENLLNATYSKKRSESS